MTGDFIMLATSTDSDIQMQIDLATRTSTLSLIGVIVVAILSGIFSIWSRRVRTPADVIQAEKVQSEEVQAEINSARQGQVAALALAAETRQSAAQMLTDLREQAKITQATIMGLNATIENLTKALEVANQTASTNSELIRVLEGELTRSRQERDREAQALAEAHSKIEERERILVKRENELREQIMREQPTEKGSA